MKVLNLLSDKLLNNVSGEKSFKLSFDDKKSKLSGDFGSFLNSNMDIKQVGDNYEVSRIHSSSKENSINSSQLSDTSKSDNYKPTDITKEDITKDGQKYFDLSKEYTNNNSERDYLNEYTHNKSLLKVAGNVAKKSIKFSDSDVLKLKNSINLEQKQSKVLGDKHINLEMYLLSLFRVISEVGRLTEIPSDIKQKVSEIRAKILDGKINVVELSNLISEIKKLSKSSDFHLKGELDKFFKDFEQVLSKLGEFSSSRGIFVGKVNEEVKTDRIVVNDYRQNDFRNSDKKEFVKNDVFNLATPVRNEVFRAFNVSQQVVSNVSNNFFVQFNMLTNAVNEFSGRVVINLRNNVNEMKMTLFPPELGKVSVKFESLGDGKLVGNIIVSSREAYTLFQEHLNVIKDNLANQGFNIVKIDVDFDNMMSGFSNERFSKGENTQMDGMGTFLRFSEKKEEYESLSKISSIYHDGSISLYA